MNAPNNNTIIFTISRMNPPTPGHLLLIQKLIEEAIRQNVQKVFVILSKTNDNNENPINCQEKINILGENVDAMNNMVIGLKNQMKIELERQELEPSVLENTRSKIDRTEVFFICVRPDQQSPIFPLYDIVREYSNIPNLNLFMIVGDDRADFLDTIADSFLFKNENINSVGGQILAREDMDAFKRLSPDQLSEIDISEVPISAFSASFVRKLVKLGMKDKFDDVYKPYLSQDKINHLYEIISEGLTKPDPKSKSSAVKPPKYSYPIIRGDEQFNEIMRNILEKAEKKAEKKATKKGGRKRKSHKKYTRKNKYKKSQKYKKIKKSKKSKNIKYN
jgi:nicotinic acid mononucleotide adenylyltransferase